jgi:probable addiction module antidote protein
MKHLTDPKEAAAYLNAVSKDGDIRFLLKALRNVVEAQGGIGKLADRTGLSRTTLYKTLSEDGNGNYPKTFGEVVLDQASRCATMQTNRTSSPFAPLNISRQPTTYLVSVELLDLTQRGSRLTLSITGGIFSNQNNKQYAAMWNDPLGRTNQLNIPIVVQ